MKRFSVLCLVLLLTCGLMACGGDANETTGPDGIDPQPVVMDLQNVYTKMGQATQLPEMLPLNESLMLDYCGISAADVKQSVVVICADSLRTDEIWLIEAVDEDAAQRIKDLANARLTKKGEESITYSPEQYAVVQKAQLLQQGNYIALIVSPEVEALAQAFRQEAGL